MEKDKIKIENTKCSPVDAAQEIYKRFQLIAQEKNLDFILKVNKNLPSLIISDCVKVGQIISNLLDNAFKFTERGKIELYIGLKTSKKLSQHILEIYVKDTGIGIPDERLEHIFEKFVQGEYYISKKYSGAGLGLPIIKELTTLMNGTITVESKLAKGTKFTVCIPVEIEKVSKRKDRI